MKASGRSWKNSANWSSGWILRRNSKRLWIRCMASPTNRTRKASKPVKKWRSEEHTSELQSQSNLVCRLLLEKEKKKPHRMTFRYRRHHHTLRNIVPQLNVTLRTHWSDNISESAPELHITHRHTWRRCTCQP